MTFMLMLTLMFMVMVMVSFLQNQGRCSTSRVRLDPFGTRFGPQNDPLRTPKPTPEPSPDARDTPTRPGAEQCKDPMTEFHPFLKEFISF